MSNHAKNAIEIRGLKRSFWRKTVLDGLDMAVPHGETHVLLGRNGAGKSTLFKVLLGALAPHAGAVSVLGLDPLRQGHLLRARIGYVPTTPDAYRWMTYPDLCRFLAAYYPTWNPGRARDLAEQLDIPQRTSLKSMSRGEGMKAMLAAALASDPELLLLDEPFAGLDPIVREEVLRGVITHLKNERRTVLCTTHDLDVAARIADRVVYLEGGRIVKEAVVEEARPDTLREELVGAAAGVGEER
ncbi:MAG: ABC transporter ATP-binding protein [Planctomycetota bacterium]